MLPIKQSWSRDTKSACLPAKCFRAASRFAANVVSIEAIRATRELVANPEVPAIFEGVFEHDGVLVRVDVLHRRRDDRWRLSRSEVISIPEVKSTLMTLAIQYRVLSRCGLDVGSCCLAHVNRELCVQRWLNRSSSVLQDQEPDSPSRAIAAKADLPATCHNLPSFQMPKAPDIVPGRQCNDPVTCEFFDRCNIPRPNDHIGYLPRMHASAAQELEELGVESICDMPRRLRVD